MCGEGPKIAVEIGFQAPAPVGERGNGCLWGWHVAIVGCVAAEDVAVGEEDCYAETCVAGCYDGRIGWQGERFAVALGRLDEDLGPGEYPEIVAVVDPGVVGLLGSGIREEVAYGAELGSAARVEEEASCRLDEEGVGPELLRGDDLRSGREVVGHGEWYDLVAIEAVDAPESGDPDEASVADGDVVDARV